jgi:methionyl-tRNA formyltransferase
LSPPDVGTIRTVFFGSGPFALPALAALAGPGTRAERMVDVVALVTAPPRPAGRRGDLRATPAAGFARAHHIPVMSPASLRGGDILAALREARPELIVLADYGRLVPAAVLRLPRHGALNLHPSLLPRHRGAAPVAAAILAGDSSTGVTLMRMDEGLDSGPILAQREVQLDGSEVAPEIEARLAGLAADLLLEALPAWLEGSLRERPQPEAGATLTRPLRRLDGRLDAQRTALELERQVRAYQPWPGSFIEAGPAAADGAAAAPAADRIIVWRATALPGQLKGAPVASGARVAPGALVPVGDSLALQTGSGLLRLDEVQPPGGRRMSGADYRRGRQRRS